MPLAVAAGASAALAQWLLWPAAPQEGLRLPGAPGSLPRPPLGASAGVPSGELQTFGELHAAMPGDWPCFRGPDRDGVCKQTVALAKSWGARGPAKLWSVPLGPGYAAPAVHNGRVYLLDYDDASQADAIRCMDLADGRELWRYSYPLKVKSNHGMSRTVPAVTDEYVVTLGPKCHLVCLDALTGRLIWSRSLSAQYGTKVPLWYAGQCPLIDDGKVIVAPGGGAFMVAIDLATGKDVWQSPAIPDADGEPWQMTHSSVVPMNLEGRRTYVYCGTGGIAGVSAADGRILWQSEAWLISEATVPTPVVLPGGRIFCSGGYKSGAKMLKIVPKGQGYDVQVVFEMPEEQFGAIQQTPILYQDHIYGVRPSGHLVCMDRAGNIAWDSGRDRFGLGPFIIADGTIYAMNDNGLLRAVRASPDKYELLGQAKVLSGVESWGPMALAGNRMLARDFGSLVCLDIAK